MKRNVSNLVLVACIIAALCGGMAPVAFAQEGPLDDQLENYWTVDRDLPVVQNRKHERAGRFGIGILVGMMSSEPFWWYLPVGGRLTYFFSNQLGLELGGQYMGGGCSDINDCSAGPFTQTTEIHRFFETRLEESFNPHTDLEDRFMWRANATLLWNPLYGKWSFLNNKLSHFDFNVALGGGAVSVFRPNFLRTDASATITPELVWGGGIHFFMSKSFVLRADGRFYVYSAADTPSKRKGYDPQDQAQTSDSASFTRRLAMPSEFQLGLTYLF